MKRVFIVDDEESILTLLEYNLEQAGYEVEKSAHGQEAYDYIMDDPDRFDFIILDIMLPGIDGTEICRMLRQEKVTTPIMMLTAKSDEYDKVISLELGADDYMTKPFSPRELIARMKAILRRTESKDDGKSNAKDPVDYELEALELKYGDTDEHIIDFGRLKIYADRYEVHIDDESIDITPTEFEILVYMALRKNRILSREQILDSLWDFDYDGGTRIIDVHISHLREKIEEDSKNPKYIQTVRGFGYKFVVPDEN